MEITYDPRYNVAFIKFREKGGEVETIHISDEINIDIASDGKIYGLELLNANEQLRLDMGFKFINQELGKTVELPIT
ncbi:MAG: DUF2283 domain-containing protein [Bacteroidota bacterium]